MGYCSNCGTSLNGAAYCSSCGTPTGLAQQGNQPAQAEPTSRYQPVSGVPAWSDLEPITSPTQWIPQVEPETPAERRGQLSVIIGAGLCFLLLAGAAIWFFVLRPISEDTAIAPTPSVITSAPGTTDATPSQPSTEPESEPATTEPEPTAEPQGPSVVTVTAQPPVVTVTASADGPGTTGATASGTTEPKTTEPKTSEPKTTEPRTTEPKTTEPPKTTAPKPPKEQPLGGPEKAIKCAPKYMVQVASASSTDALKVRVAELRAAGELPNKVHWAMTKDSCDIFAAQNNVAVLYAGPFDSPAAACPARLASPADAFIKGTTTATSTEYISCLCPAEVASLPRISKAGDTGVWVGELQRVLGAKLNYDVGEINGNPSAGVKPTWGIYTRPTADAVGRFQDESGLAVTKKVDAGTWAALQIAGCG